MQPKCRENDINITSLPQYNCLFAICIEVHIWRLYWEGTVWQIDQSSVDSIDRATERDCTRGVYIIILLQWRRRARLAIACGRHATIAILVAEDLLIRTDACYLLTVQSLTKHSRRTTKDDVDDCGSSTFRHKHGGRRRPERAALSRPTPRYRAANQRVTSSPSILGDAGRQPGTRLVISATTTFDGHISHSVTRMTAASRLITATIDRSRIQ